MRLVIQTPAGFDAKPSCHGSALDPQPFGASLLTSRETRLTARCNLRLTQSELERLRDDAEAAGLSVSQLVRRRYFGRPVAHRSEAQLSAELRRLGGLLKHLHNESGGAHSARSSQVLDLIAHHLRASLAARKGGQ